VRPYRAQPRRRRICAGALRGRVAPAEGGSGKAEGFGARGETSPLFIYIKKIKGGERL